MKKVNLLIKNAQGESLPIDDTETFTTFLAEIPLVGDEIVILNPQVVSPEDQILELLHFLQNEIPSHHTRNNWAFKVVGRTLFRVNNNSFINIDIQQKPWRATK